MRHLLLLTVLFLFLCACAGPLGTGSSNLPQLTDRFSEAMRWQDYPGAAQFLEPQPRTAFLAQFQEDADLHVVDSSIKSVNPGKEEGFVEVTYQLDYYRLPSTRIDRWNWTQEWRRQPGKVGKEAIWLISNLPPALPWSD